MQTYVERLKQRLVDEAGCVFCKDPDIGWVCYMPHGSTRGAGAVTATMIGHGETLAQCVKQAAEALGEQV